MNIVEFLEARLTEDEVRAQVEPWHAEGCDHLPSIGSDYTYPCDCGVPDRMRRDAEAKRRVIRAGGSSCGSYIDPNSPEDVAREDEYREHVGAERYESEQRDHWPAAYAPYCDGCAAAESADHDRDWVLRVLVTVYSDHPDYSEEWKP